MQNEVYQLYHLFADPSILKRNELDYASYQAARNSYLNDIVRKLYKNEVNDAKYMAAELRVFDFYIAQTFDIVKEISVNV